MENVTPLTEQLRPRTGRVEDPRSTRADFRVGPGNQEAIKGVPVVIRQRIQWLRWGRQHPDGVSGWLLGQESSQVFGYLQSTNLALIMISHPLAALNNRTLPPSAISSLARGDNRGASVIHHRKTWGRVTGSPLEVFQNLLWQWLVELRADDQLAPRAPQHAPLRLRGRGDQTSHRPAGLRDNVLLAP